MCYNDFLGEKERSSHATARIEYDREKKEDFAGQY